MYCLITSNGWPRSASIVIWIGWSISSWEILLHTIVLKTNQSSRENNQKTRVKGNTTQQGQSDLITFSLDFNCQPPPTADLLFLACRRRLPIRSSWWPPRPHGRGMQERCGDLLRCVPFCLSSLRLMLWFGCSLVCSYYHYVLEWLISVARILERCVYRFLACSSSLMPVCKELVRNFE